MLRNQGPLLARSPKLRNVHHISRRRYTPTTPVNSSPSAESTAQSRIQRMNSRLPKFLRPYTTPLLHAPVSHITAFLLLHELTAIIPLVGLATTFHYMNWLPSSLSESAYVKDGVETFARYFKRKGWFGENVGSDDVGDGKASAGEGWRFSEGGVKIVVEVATAYAITKALLPLRLVLSVWATPWFARFAVLPVTNWTSRLFGTKVRKAAIVPVSGGTTASIGGAARPP